MKNKNMNPFGTSRLVFEKVEGPEPENIKHTSVLEDLDAAWESDAEKENKQVENKIAALEKRLDAMQASQQPKVANAPTTQASTDQSWFDKARGKIPEPATSVAQPAATPAKAPAGKPKVAASAGGPGDTGPTAPPKAGAEPQKESAERTPEQKFQLMMDKYVGDEKLISAENFAKALNSVNSNPSVPWTTESISNKSYAIPIVEAVKNLQKKLNAEKNAGLDTDGIFGEKTNVAYHQKIAGGKAPEAVPPAPVPGATPGPAEEVPAVQPPAVETRPPAPVEAQKQSIRLSEFNNDNFLKTAYVEGINATTMSEANLKTANVPSGTVVYKESEANGVITVTDAQGNSHSLPKENLTNLSQTSGDTTAREKFKADRFAKEAGDVVKDYTADPSKVRKLNDGTFVVITKEDSDTHLVTVRKIGSNKPETEQYHPNNLAKIDTETTHEIYTQLATSYANAVTTHNNNNNNNHNP